MALFVPDVVDVAQPIKVNAHTWLLLPRAFRWVNTVYKVRSTSGLVDLLLRGLQGKGGARCTLLLSWLCPRRTLTSAHTLGNICKSPWALYPTYFTRSFIHTYVRYINSIVNLSASGKLSLLDLKGKLSVFFLLSHF